MIGATMVMRLAGAVERSLQESRSADVVEGILKKLAASLCTLREEAKAVLDNKSAPAAATDRAAISVSSDELLDFGTLLETQNLAAVEKFSSLAPALEDMLDANCFERLRDAVENLDFQLGADLLRNAPTERLLAVGA